MADLGGLVVTVEELGEPVVAVVVAVGGEIDQVTASQFEEGVARGVAVSAESANARLVIKLDEVTFCGSAGLEQLVKAHDAAHAHGLDLVVVARPKGMVERVLELTDLASLFTVVPTLDRALPVGRG